MRIGTTTGRSESAKIPQEARKLSWGAFGLSWIWGLFNRSYVTLIVFLPYAAALVLLGLFKDPGTRLLIRLAEAAIVLAMSVFFLFKGKAWAWRNRDWESVEGFVKVQRRWAWGALIVPLSLVVSVASVFVITATASKNGGDSSRSSSVIREAESYESAPRALAWYELGAIRTRTRDGGAVIAEIKLGYDGSAKGASEEIRKASARIVDRLVGYFSTKASVDLEASKEAPIKEELKGMINDMIPGALIRDLALTNFHVLEM
jgi:flagellar basal body-associated protein FliL